MTKVKVTKVVTAACSCGRRDCQAEVGVGFVEAVDTSTGKKYTCTFMGKMYADGGFVEGETVTLTKDFEEVED